MENISQKYTLQDRESFLFKDSKSYRKIENEKRLEEKRKKEVVSLINKRHHKCSSLIKKLEKNKDDLLKLASSLNLLEDKIFEETLSLSLNQLENAFNKSYSLLIEKSFDEYKNASESIEDINRIAKEKKTNFFSFLAYSQQFWTFIDKISPFSNEIIEEKDKEEFRAFAVKLGLIENNDTTELNPITLIQHYDEKLHRLSEEASFYREKSHLLFKKQFPTQY
jgi:hypothetical protein